MYSQLVAALETNKGRALLIWTGKKIGRVLPALFSSSVLWDTPALGEYPAWICWKHPLFLPDQTASLLLEQAHDPHSRMAPSFVYAKDTEQLNKDDTCPQHVPIPEEE